jgi:uncharacterized protein YeaO (DUF488 family)
MIPNIIEGFAIGDLGIIVIVMKTRGSHEFRIKRVYEKPSADDGLRFLVDRLWPRGVRKEALHAAHWLKNVAPSSSLRKWFGHDAGRWPEFCRRYRSELEKNAAAWAPLMEAAHKDTVTLLFAARQVEMNQATVLRDFLAERAGGR